MEVALSGRRHIMSVMNDLNDHRRRFAIKKRLERELNGQNGYNCPNSSLTIKMHSERNQRSVICLLSKALEENFSNFY